MYQVRGPTALAVCKYNADGTEITYTVSEDPEMVTSTAQVPTSQTPTLLKPQLKQPRYGLDPKQTLSPYTLWLMEQIPARP